MKYDNTVIVTATHELPPNVVSSEQIEARLAPVYERLRFSYGRLEMMTGIRERRYWEPDFKPSAGAAIAGEKAIQASGIPREEIGCLIHGAVCRDFLEPSTASVIHHKLGLSADAQVFDLGSACLGIVKGVTVVANMIEMGQIKAGLVVGCEVAGPVLNATIDRILNDDALTRKSFKSHFASLTLGSGASAILLAHRSLTDKGFDLLGGGHSTDTSANTFCQEDTNESSALGPLMATDSEALLEAGIRVASRTWDITLKSLDWTPECVDHLFTHQVGVAHRKQLYDMLGIDADRDFITYDRLGNIGACGVPTAFAMGVNGGVEFKTGERLLLMGIGSGVSSLMLGLKVR